MKKLFLLFFIVLFVIPIALAVPVSYTGTITYEGDEITSEHTIKAESASRTTTKTITESNFVINHLVKKGEIVKFYFDGTSFTEYIQPLPGSVIDLETWDITPTGLPDLYEAKSALTYALILNGNPSEDNVIADLYLPTSLAAYPDVSIEWVSSDGNVTNTGTVIRDNSDHTVTLTATLSKVGEDDITSTFTVTVKQTVAAAVPDETGKVEINYSEPEIVIDNSNINDIETIEIPETVSANEIVSLNLKSLMTEENTVTLGTNDLTLTRKTNSSVNYSIEFPAGTEISGGSDWNGLLTLPTVNDNSEVETTEGEIELVIEVGFTGGQLNFSKAVKLTLAGMTGKKVGYTHGTELTIISLVCTSATDASNIVGNGECYYDDNTDLLIWTKHFTRFAAYTTPTPTPPTPPADTGGNGGGPAAGGGGGGCAPGYKLENFRCVKIVEEEIEEEAEEVPAEEEEAEEVAPTEGAIVTEEEPTEPAAPTGLAAIIGAVIGVATGKTGYFGSLIIIIIVVGSLFLFSHFYGGMPGADHFTRAANFHKRAQKAHRKGRHEKAEELYRKAQEIREEGEKRLR